MNNISKYKKDDEVEYYGLLAIVISVVITDNVPIYNIKIKDSGHIIRSIRESQLSDVRK